MGVDKHTIALLRGLHDGSWFRIGDLPTVILSQVGGRQGCKVGSMVFNSVYSIALDALHAALKRDGLSLHLPVPDGPFWSADAGEKPQMVDVADCTFVDDECIVVMQPTAASLDRAIDKKLGHATDIFSALRLEINWNQRKTEAMVRFRGCGSQAILERRRVDGQLRIAVPGNLVHSSQSSIITSILDVRRHWIPRR